MNTGGEDGGGCLGQPHANATMEGRQGSKEHTNACTIHGNVAWKTTTGCLQYKSDLTSVGCFVCPYVREILPVKAGGWQLVVKVQKIR